MKLNWNQIMSNAVTVLVATVFVGAATYLWHGVQTIDQRIDKNVSSIRATQEVIAPKVDRLEEIMEELISHHLPESNKTEMAPQLEFKRGEDSTINLIDVRQHHSPSF